MIIQTKGIHSLDEILMELKSKLPQYEVEYGWGIVNWILVKQSWYIGLHVTINERKKLIVVRKYSGSILGALVMGGGSAFSLINNCNIIYNDTCAVLKLRYG